MAMDDFESRVLGLSPKKEGPEDDDFLRELEEIERSATWGATGRRDENELDGELDEDEDDDEGDEEWEDDRGQVLSDAALAAIVDYDLDDEEKPYQFRPDRYFFPGQKYDPEVIIFISLDSLSSQCYSGYPSTQWDFLLKVGPILFSIACFAYKFKDIFLLVGHAWRIRGTYAGSLRAKLILAPLGIPKWVWPFMNW